MVSNDADENVSGRLPRTNEEAGLLKRAHPQIADAETL